MAYRCPSCEQRGQTWSGDAPKCGFHADGTMTEHNWNCATLNALRDLAEPVAIWQEDQNYATLPLWEVVDHTPSRVFPEWPLALWVTWYKRRGATDALYLLFDDIEPRVPTLAQCEAVIAYHEARR